MNNIVIEKKQLVNEGDLLAAERYLLGLIITEGKKTCTRIAERMNVSHDTLSKVLEYEADYSSFINSLIVLIKLFPKNCCLINDDSMIAKKFAEKLECATKQKDVCDGVFKKSFSIVVLCVSIFEYVFPIDVKIWTGKAYSKENYNKKAELMIESIKKHSEIAKLTQIAADGLYATNEIIDFLISETIKFDMRAASNRKVELEDGTCDQLKNLKQLKRTKNEKTKTILCKWHGKILYVTAVFYIDKKGVRRTKYIFSNYKAASMEHKNAYDKRWKIEVFFRSGKQDLGLSDCRSRIEQHQFNHISYSIKAYVLCKWKAFSRFISKKLKLLKIDPIGILPMDKLLVYLFDHIFA